MISIFYVRKGVIYKFYDFDDEEEESCKQLDFANYKSSLAYFPLNS